MMPEVIRVLSVDLAPGLTEAYKAESETQVVVSAPVKPIMTWGLCDVSPRSIPSMVMANAPSPWTLVLGTEETSTTSYVTAPENSPLLFKMVMVAA